MNSVRHQFICLKHAGTAFGCLAIERGNASMVRAMNFVMEDALAVAEEQFVM